MKPRNKTERLVAELSSKLPAITEKQKQWAKDTCFEKNPPARNGAGQVNGR